MSDDDEDWFERALRDTEGDDTAEDDQRGADARDADDAADSRADEGGAGDTDGAADSWLDRGAGQETEGAAGSRMDRNGDHGEASGGGAGSGVGDRGGNWFSEVEGSGVETDDGDFFDDEFGEAFGGPGGEFDEESFDSAIPRIDMGIEGLDDMILGGVPERHLIVCIGGAGSGKTTFGLQFLHHGLRNDQNGVFITLEQSYEDIMDTAAEHGWEFDRFEREDTLAVVDLDPVEMANSLDNIRGELPDLITDFDADRLVLDSVSLLEMMYDDEARRRTEVFDFTRSLKQAGVTTFLTSEASDEHEYASRYGIIEYLTDAVFLLQYIRGEAQETRLAVEIQKIRNANHSRERKPYEITEGGISVYQQANIF